MDQQIADDTKFLVRENVLAVTSNKSLVTVGSAVFNGGFKRVNAVLNVGVPQGYSDQSLHIDPIELISSSAAKLGITENYLAMITAANINNYSLVSKKTDVFSVSVIATAGCSHGESSGEEMDVQELTGTINTIVLIDGNPSESCMVAAVITATEAKSAVLRDFDIRSRYTGDSATGSITDSVVVVSTCKGKTLSLAGPASRLGKLIGYCTRRAVTEALLKQEPIWARRTVLERLKERHIPLEKLVAEVSKVKDLIVEEADIIRIFEKNSLASIHLLAAIMLDDYYRKDQLPMDIDDLNEVSRCFGAFFQCRNKCPETNSYDAVDLPSFLKHTIISIIKNSQSEQ